MSENNRSQCRATGCDDIGQPRYAPPRVILYSEDALLERLGPAKACASFPVFGSSAEPERPSGAKKFDFDL